jgi:hypothetical protein
MKRQILVDEDIIETAADMIEAATKYLNALREINLTHVATSDAIKLQEIARKAMGQGDDIMVLSQRFLAASQKKES